MATEDEGKLDLSFEAGADLSGDQYKLVELGTDRKVTVCNAITDVPIGVLQNKPTSGQTAQVRVRGTSKVQADAAIDEGVLVGTSADGQADAKAGTEVGEYVIGIVTEAAGAAGELATVLLSSPPSRTAG